MKTLGRKLVIGAMFLVIGLGITNATLWAVDPLNVLKASMKNPHVELTVLL